MSKSDRPSEVRPVSKGGMANDSMSSLNLSRGLENSRADSLGSQNLAMALRPQTPAAAERPSATAQQPSERSNTQQSPAVKGKE